MELIGTDQGLSQGMVFDLLQSRDGFLWIATKDGLNRYDGYRFEVFSPDAFNPFSIASGEIQTIFEDSRGWLWLCYSGGIDVFEPVSGRFVHLHVRDIEGFSGYNVSLFEDADGTIWVAAGQGILKISAAESTVRQAIKDGRPFPEFLYSVIEMPKGATGLPAPEANSVFQMEDQNLFAATTTGLYRLDAKVDKLGPQPVALPGFNIAFLGHDRAGRLWFHSTEMVCSIRGLQKRPDFIRKKLRNSNWLLDAEGNIWGKEDGNVVKWNPDNLVRGKDPDMRVGLAGQVSRSEAFYLTSFLIDRSGNIWAGTSGYGMLKKATGRPKFNSYQPGVSHINLYEDPSSGRIFTLRNVHTIYAGRQFDTGLFNAWFTKFPTSVPIDFVAFDPQGNCWVKSSNQKICRIDARTKDYACFEAPGYGLWAASTGLLLSLSQDGLLAFDPQKKTTRLNAFNQSLSRGYRICDRQNLFYESRDGTLWIFAYEGLLKATPAGEGYRYERFFNNPSDRSTLSNNVVLSAAEDPAAPQRYLWVGTKGGGLNRLDLQTGRFRHFTTAHGLPDNVVYGILSDRAGHLWMSTNKGLCRFNTHDFSVKNFTATDGLQNNEFNQGSFLKTSDGYLIFGGVNGLTVFHPDSLRFNEHAPPVQLVGLRVNNDPRSLPGSVPLELTHRQNVLTIEIAALDFVNPARNQYRYQLIRHGILGKANDNESEWINLAGNRTVQLVNLQPGRYTFRALGSNNDGIWSTEPALLHFIIAPPWWASWWAYLLYAATLVAAVFTLYRYQLRRRLDRQDALRLRELDVFKNRFFTNVTHEFRTPLTVILGMAERLERAESDRAAPSRPVTEAPQDRGPAGLIRRNGENLLRLVNQILDLAKLESGALQLHYVQGDVAAYLRYIAESLHSAADIHGVRLRVTGPAEPVVMDYDPERLLQIVHNLLSNAIKFTPSGGELVLHWARGTDLPRIDNNLEGLFVIRVADTGVGIPSDDLPHIFDRFYQAKNLGKAKTGGTGIGLALTKELVQAMGGVISVESEVGTGTTFTVQLPISNKAAIHSEGVSDAAEPWLRLPAFVAPKAADRSTVGVPPDLPIAGNRRPVTPADTLPTILLVEDNPDVLEYLAACLAPHYTLDFASNGRIGIEKAVETVPDLIVSDVMMPEKDGFEVCEMLKNDERTSHIPLVLLTAKADVQYRIAGLRRGADAYLGKPFHEEELLVTLANLLETRKKLQAKYGNAAVLVEPPAAVPDSDPEDAFLQKVRAVVERQISEPELDMSRLEQMLAMSRSQLFRKIKALTGRSPSQFVRSIRLHHGRRLLQTTGLTVSEIAYEVGFSSVKYFSDAFLEEFGERPTGVRG